MSERSKTRRQGNDTHSGGPGGALGRPVEKPKNFKKTTGRLLGYLKPQRINLIVVTIFAVASTIFTVWAPKITGNAVNQMTNGFIAKTIVDGISFGQTGLKDMLNSYNDAVSNAKTQADLAAENAVNSAVEAQKQAAYAQAEAAADEAVTQQFNATIAGQKQAACAQAKAAAEASAKAAVDAKFKALVPGIPEDQLSSIPGYTDALNTAYAAADSQAIDAVDAQFAANQSAIDAQLAQAKQKAEALARQQVDSAFADKQADIDSQIASAKETAESQATDAVNQAFMDQEGITQDQLDTLLSLAQLPLLSDTPDYSQRADIVQSFLNGMKTLPTSLFSSSTSDVNISNISDENLATYVEDIRQTGGYIPFDAIAQTLLFLLFIYALSAVFTFVMQFIMSSVSQKVVYALRKNLDEKLARLPLRYYDSHSNGEILSRMTNDIDTISTTLQQSLTQLITSLLQLIGYIIMMLTISPLLTLFVLLTLPLYIITTMLIAKKSQKFYAAQQKYLGELSGHTEEMFTGHKIVRAFGREQQSIDIFNDINDKHFGVAWKAQFLSGIMFPVMNFISNLGYVLISVVGGIFVTRTWLNLGDITAFISYSRSFTMPIIQTANIANVIQSTIACAERVFDVLDEEEEIPDKEDSEKIAAPQGNVRFEHVNFSYKENEPLIEDMNINVKKGDTIAIVGPTGAGKTTLVNLLMRFYEVNDGSITFDDIDTRNLRRGDLRTLFGMVLQDTWLFNGTIEENIRYGRENVTHEEIVAAAKAAHADHFIRSLPDGYNTILNEEASNISQGQKQLLTIARAVLADPVVLILDEATSSVDTRTEVLIQKAMGKLMEGRTSFVIAHRLSTIRDAKMILVMNHGSIIESGSHDELLAQKGFYADLYNSQFTGPSVEEQAV